MKEIAKLHKKIGLAKNSLANMSLKKSGRNDYAKYTYFELQDFMPAVISIFNEIGLASEINFYPEYATLRIIDTDTGESTMISSPMAEAHLKGCHPVQNLGASETYIRRYLWTTALDITDGDALDSAPLDAEPPKKTTKKAAPKAATITAEQVQAIKDFITENKLDQSKVLAHFKVDKIENLAADKYDRAKEALEKSLEKKKAA